MNRKHFLAALVAALIPVRAAAQTQVVSNKGQIVSTGDVWVEQDAAGNQTVYDASGRAIATQTVGNDLQVVSTGDVYAGQRAAGSQTVFGKSSGICEPGEFVVLACGIEICTEDCEWVMFRCPGCAEKCRRC